MILSLQGCMAVGKTTVVNRLRDNAPWVHISYEENADVIRRVKESGLDKNRYEDYLQIQRLWIENEVSRYRSAAGYPCTVMDFGAEEIEFYTLHYPQSIGQVWEIENALKDELAELRRCLPSRILFLDASEETLRARRAHDPVRTRPFFEHHLQRLMPLKREWFARKDNVDWLCVDELSPQEVGERVKAWAEACIGRNG